MVVLAAPLHDPSTGTLIGASTSAARCDGAPAQLRPRQRRDGDGEDALRLRRAAEEERLRDAYLERIARLGRHRSAMISPDGRVLIAQPAGWVGPTVDLPGAGGPVSSPTGARRSPSRSKAAATCCGA